LFIFKVAVKKPFSLKLKPLDKFKYKLSPSPKVCFPKVKDAFPPAEVSFKTILITPAMASEPYCAAAPSLNTSIRFIAATGIALMSVPAVPLPTVGFICIKLA